MSEFLKCDAPGCDHSEDVPEITESMIGKPCPKCGASLLTRADYDIWAVVFVPAMKAGLLAPAEPNTPGAVRVNWHDGELRLRMSPPNHNKEAGG